MASRSSSLVLLPVLLVLAALSWVGCAEPSLEVGTDHPANAEASVRPIAAPPAALSSGYDPAVHLPPPPGGGHQHHHHGHGDHAPSTGGAAPGGSEP